MPSNHPSKAFSNKAHIGVLVLGIVCLASAPSAVGKDKAFYLGGTVKDFIPSRTIEWDRVQPLEGRIQLASASEFIFEAGKKGTLKIRYDAITSLEYGRERGRHVPGGVLTVLPWDPFDQYTKNAHDLLSIVYRDPALSEQAIILELGRDLLRPVIEALERRSGRTVEFLNVEACLLFRSAQACNYGQPTELKGLTRVFLDQSIAGERRNLIHTEIEKASPNLEVLASPEGAQIVLKYDGASSLHPECPCHGGRGEVLVVDGSRQRVVLVFTGATKGVWGKKPEIGFVDAFAEAVSKANAAR